MLTASSGSLRWWSLIFLVGIGFALIYGIVAVVWFRLVRHLSRQPLAPPVAAPDVPLETPVY